MFKKYFFFVEVYLTPTCVLTTSKFIFNLSIKFRSYTRQGNSIQNLQGNKTWGFTLAITITIVHLN